MFPKLFHILDLDGDKVRTSMSSHSVSIPILQIPLKEHQHPQGAQHRWWYWHGEGTC